MNNNDLNKIEYYNLLFDFYKKTLTPKQRKYFELYYINDYSYDEIASENNISKSGVHDSITKTIKQLEKMEVNLELLSKSKKIKGLIDDFKKNKLNIENLIEIIEEECC